MERSANVPVRSLECLCPYFSGAKWNLSGDTQRLAPILPGVFPSRPFALSMRKYRHICRINTRYICRNISIRWDCLAGLPFIFLGEPIFNKLSSIYINLMDNSPGPTAANIDNNNRLWSRDTIYFRPRFVYTWEQFRQYPVHCRYYTRIRRQIAAACEMIFAATYNTRTLPYTYIIAYMTFTICISHIH